MLFHTDYEPQWLTEFCFDRKPVNKVNKEELAKEKNLGCKKESVGNPCNAATGNKYQSEVDYSSPQTGLSFIRHYNSQYDEDAGLGFGWTAINVKRLERYGDLIQVRSASGRGYPFQKQTDGSWKPDSDTTETLIATGSGYVLTYRDGSKDTYDGSGKLLTETQANGRVTSYTY